MKDQKNSEIRVKFVEFFKQFYAYYIPIIIGIIPVVHLYAENAEEVSFKLIVGPVFVFVLSSLLISYILLKIIKDRPKSTIIVGLFWVYFFFYSSFFSNVDEILAKDLVRHRNMFFLWWILFLTSAYLVLRTKKINAQIIKPIGIFGVVVLVLQLLPLLSLKELPNTKSTTPSKNAYSKLLNNETKLLEPKNKKLPDIYYIMPDGYPRKDTLKEYFGFDNSEFIDFLSLSGFFVAKKNHSNYDQTTLSVPSGLNMSYLVDSEKDSLTRSDNYSLYNKNKTVDFLKTGGYKYVDNSKLYNPLDSNSADHIVRCSKNNEFLNELLNMSTLKPFKLVGKLVRKNKRDDVLCVFDKITKNPISSPKFVFTHMYPPHPPYIFGENGEDVHEVNIPLSRSDFYKDTKSYVNQLVFVNKKLKNVVNDILSKSKDAIILIQSDHGSFASANVAKGLSPHLDDNTQTLKERSRNFMAVRLPDYCDKRQLNDSITPVNTFRIIFNACFDADYDLLENKTYFYPPNQMTFSNFRDITSVIEDK